MQKTNRGFGFMLISFKYTKNFRHVICKHSDRYRVHSGCSLRRVAGSVFCNILNLLTSEFFLVI